MGDWWQVTSDWEEKDRNEIYLRPFCGLSQNLLEIICGRALPASGRAIRCKSSRKVEASSLHGPGFSLLSLTQKKEFRKEIAQIACTQTSNVACPQSHRKRLRFTPLQFPKFSTFFHSSDLLFYFYTINTDHLRRGGHHQPITNFQLLIT